MQFGSDGGWPDLPEDLLLRIASLLHFPDFVCCAAACRTWRSTIASSRRTCSPLPTPSLLFSSSSNDDSGDAPTLVTLHDLHCYPLRLPDLNRRKWLGSSHGWLVTADDRSDLHLFNPLSGAEMPLPSPATLEHVRRRFNNAGNLVKYDVYYFDWKRPRKPFQSPESHPLEGLRHHLYEKAVLSGDPLAHGDCIVVLKHQPYSQLSFTRVGDVSWNWISLPTCSDYVDVIFHNGLLYALTYGGSVHGIDLNGLFPLFNVILEETHISWRSSWVEHQTWRYLARSPSGDLLIVLREERGDWPTTTMKVKVYKVDLSEEVPVEIVSLGNYTIFTGYRTSTCLPAAGLVKPDCIHFTDGPDLRPGLAVYNLQDESFDKMQAISSRIHMPPIWIFPSF